MPVRDRIRSDVRDACEEYIAACREYLDSERDRPLEDILADTDTEIYSTRELKEEELGTRSMFSTQISVAQPSQLLAEIPDPIANAVFDPVSMELAERTDYPLDRKILSLSSLEEIEILRTQFVESLVKFTGEVMDYAGDVSFDQDAFETAYDDQFNPSYTDREVYDVVIPMPGVSIETEIELSDIPSLDTKYEGPYEIEQLVITPLPDRIVHGIRTYYAQEKGHSEFSDSPADAGLHFRLRRHRSYFEILTRVGGRSIPELGPTSISVFPIDRASWDVQDTIVRELVNTVKRTLHLWNPRVNPGFENGYLLAPNWLDYRESTANVVDQFHIENEDSEGVLTLSEAGDSLVEFWKQYAWYLTDRGSFVRKPLARLETMFDRGNPEDAILDALIGLEGSLLQDTAGSSYTFRMKLRSRLLLEGLSHHDWTAKKTGETATDLYCLRGYLVHNDDSIQEAIQKADLDQLGQCSGHEAMAQARILLARVILAYLDQDVKHHLKPGDVNTGLDEAALTASYDPDRAVELSQDDPEGDE